ncbi:MAG: exodeoxyribonuclease VII small subunit [Desulfovibrionaceae bacterium]
MAREKKNTVSESFETRLARLQEIVTHLETGSLPLEQGLTLYKEGMELSKLCRGQLEQARNEIRLLTAQGLEPFTPEEDENA